MQSPITTPPILSAPTLPYATPSTLAIPPDWTNPETFTLDPALRSQHLRLLLVLLSLFRLLFLALFAVLLIFVLHYDLPLILGLLAFLILLSAFATLRAVRRHRRAWPTYRLLLADQGLIARSLTMPLTRIDAPDILRIARTWDGYKITLRSRRHLTLSKRLLRQPALHAKLSRFRPIDPGHGLLGAAAYVASTWLVVIALLLVAVVGILSDNPNTVLLSLFLSLALFTFTLLRIFRTKGLPLRTRILSFIQLLIPLDLLAHWLLLHYFPP